MKCKWQPLVCKLEAVCRLDWVCVCVWQQHGASLMAGRQALTRIHHVFSTVMVQFSINKFLLPFNSSVTHTLFSFSFPLAHYFSHCLAREFQHIGCLAHYFTRKKKKKTNSYAYAWLLNPNWFEHWLEINATASLQQITDRQHRCNRRLKWKNELEADGTTNQWNWRKSNKINRNNLKVKYYECT